MGGKDGAGELESEVQALGDCVVAGVRDCVAVGAGDAEALMGVRETAALIVREPVAEPVALAEEMGDLLRPLVVGVALTQTLLVREAKALADTDILGLGDTDVEGTGDVVTVTLLDTLNVVVGEEETAALSESEHDAEEVIDKVASGESVAVTEAVGLCRGDAEGVTVQVGRYARPVTVHEEGQGHVVQLAAPANENVPTGQSTALTEEKGQKEPAGHSTGVPEEQ